MNTERTADIDAHLRDHLTDGAWHDSCGYCLRRRVHGGTGVPSAAARVTSPALTPGTETEGRQ